MGQPDELSSTGLPQIPRPQTGVGRWPSSCHHRRGTLAGIGMWSQPETGSHVGEGCPEDFLQENREV